LVKRLAGGLQERSPERQVRERIRFERNRILALDRGLRSVEPDLEVTIDHYDQKRLGDTLGVVRLDNELTNLGVRVVLGAVVHLQARVIELHEVQGDVVNERVSLNRLQGLGLPRTPDLGVTTIEAELGELVRAGVADQLEAGRKRGLGESLDVGNGRGRDELIRRAVRPQQKPRRQAVAVRGGKNGLVAKCHLRSPTLGAEPPIESSLES